MKVTEETCLGPATARAVDGKRVRVEMEDEEVWARLAMPWIPAPGDEVLVTGKEGTYYVIGLLDSAAPVVISAPGDLELRSETGQIRIQGARGVEVRSPRILLATHTLIQRVTDAYHWVKGLFHVKAERMSAVAERESIQKSGRAFLLADEDVKLQGRQIHLG